jgi:type I restriction enzyme S subunit
MSVPAYEEYKDSGYEWVGPAVPEHWKVRRLKSLVVEPLKYGANESAEDEDRSEPRFVRITDINDDGGLRDETFKSLPAEIAEPYLLHEGDVLLARSGATVGKSFIYSKEWGTACFAGYLIRARLRPSECLPTWLSYFCQTDAYWGYVAGSQIQATIQNVSAEKYANLYLPIPPLPEQTAIASFLDAETSKIDSLVSEQRRLIELLKEKRQAVISHAVTKGLDPDVKMKPSGIEWLGEVPEHWEVIRIKYAITSIEQGWSPQCEISPVESDEQWGVLKVGCVNYGRFTPEQNKALPSTLEPQPELGIRKDDLLISRANTIELVGSAAVAERDYGNLMLCDKLYRLRMDHSRLCPRFLCCFLTCEIAREPIELGATGASPSMKNIAQSAILELWFAAPNIDEQLQIVTAIQEQCEALTKLIAQAERAIELLQERRTALISAAVTGKIDVRELATEVVVA